MWKYGRVGVWECGGVDVWTCVSVGVCKWETACSRGVAELAEKLFLGMGLVPKLTITGDSGDGRRQHFLKSCTARLERGGHKTDDRRKTKGARPRAKDERLLGPWGGRGRGVGRGPSTRGGTPLPREAEGSVWAWVKMSLVWV